MGSARSAAEEVQYPNGAANTRWGAERARNGHPKPTVRLEFAGSTRYHSAQAWRIDEPNLGTINDPVNRRLLQL